MATNVEHRPEGEEAASRTGAENAPKEPSKSKREKAKGGAADAKAAGAAHRGTLHGNGGQPPPDMPGAPEAHDAGAFTVTLIDGGEFDIAPRNIPNPIPEEQAALSHGIYATWGVMKRLRDRKQFKGDEAKFEEFRKRLLQVADVGLQREHVKSRLAAKALDQIRAEIAMRKGLAVKTQYLARLGAWALALFAVGVALALLHKGIWGLPAGPDLYGYGFVLMGSAAGTWLSVAATRRAIAFEEMPDFVGPLSEPFFRLVFVGGISLTLALLLALGVLKLELSGFDFANFERDAAVALLLGVFAGLSERAVSVRITNTATGVFSAPSPAP